MSVDLDGQSGRMTVRELQEDPVIQKMLMGANACLDAAGYTEHGQRHAGRVAELSSMILSELHYDERTCELAGIAA